MADEPLPERQIDPESRENRAALIRELELISEQSRFEPHYTPDEIDLMVEEAWSTSEGTHEQQPSTIKK